MVVDPTRLGGLDPLDVEARLTALEQASDERRVALREQLDRLPHAVSRRTVVTTMLTDLRSAPAKTQLARRGLRKVLRTPGALVRRVARKT